MPVEMLEMDEEQKRAHALVQEFVTRFDVADPFRMTLSLEMMAHGAVYVRGVLGQERAVEILRKIIEGLESRREPEGSA